MASLVSDGITGKRFRGGAEQGGAEQIRADQSRPKQGKAGQSNAGRRTAENGRRRQRRQRRAEESRGRRRTAEQGGLGWRISRAGSSRNSGAYALQQLLPAIDAQRAQRRQVTFDDGIAVGHRGNRLVEALFPQQVQDRER